MAETRFEDLVVQRLEGRSSGYARFPGIAKLQSQEIIDAVKQYQQHDFADFLEKNVITPIDNLVKQLETIDTSADAAKAAQAKESLTEAKMQLAGTVAGELYRMVAPQFSEMDIDFDKRMRSVKHSCSAKLTTLLDSQRSQSPLFAKLLGRKSQVERLLTQCIDALDNFDKD